MVNSMTDKPEVYASPISRTLTGKTGKPVYVWLWDRAGPRGGILDEQDFSGDITVQECDYDSIIDPSGPSFRYTARRKDKKVEVRVKNDKGTQSYIMRADDALRIFSTLQGASKP